MKKRNSSKNSRPKKNTLKIEIVSWHDSYHGIGWKTYPEEMPHISRPGYCTSAGILVEEDKTNLRLCLSYGEGREYGHFLTIPKRCVWKRKVIGYIEVA